MVTVGSIKRNDLLHDFPFLAESFSGRRKAIKDFTHHSPDFVFWIYPDGLLYDAKDAHRKNYPKGYRHILDDFPDYGGFIRGRVASNQGRPIIVVYCREDALLSDRDKIDQLSRGLDQLPIPLTRDTIVISDNGDLYGTLEDVEGRMYQ